METWLIPALVALIPAAAAVVAAAVSRVPGLGNVARANRLSDVIERMRQGTPEREFAERYRDDLVTGWIIATMRPFSFGAGMTLFTFSYFMMTAATIGLVLLADDAARRNNPGLILLALAALGGVVAGLTTVVKALIHADRFDREVRAAHGLQEPLDSWRVRYRDARRRSSHPPETEQAGSSSPPENQN